MILAYVMCTVRLRSKTGLVIPSPLALHQAPSKKPNLVGSLCWFELVDRHFAVENWEGDHISLKLVTVCV